MRVRASLIDVSGGGGGSGGGGSSSSRSERMEERTDCEVWHVERRRETKRVGVMEEKLRSLRGR